MRKAVGIISLVFVVLYFIGRRSDTETAPNPRDASPKEVYSTTSEQLFRMYDNNEVATDNMLKPYKAVEITGYVDAISKDFFDQMYVILKTPNPFMSAHIHVPKSEEAKLIQMRKGQSARFRCAKMKLVAGSPWGDDCIVMGY